MKKFVGLLLCLSVSFFIVARVAKPSHTPAAAAKTAQEKATGQKADAERLLKDASKALVAMIKAARADSGLDPKTAKNKPFWKSTQLIAKNLKTAKTGLAAKNDDFFKGIAAARKADEQMKVDWQLTASESFDMSESEQEDVAAEEDTNKEVASADDDSVEEASDGEGEDMNLDDGGGDAGDQDTGDDE
jgi:hypothetical protein